MKIAVIAFTVKGCELAKKISSLLVNDICTVYAPERLAVSLNLNISGSLDKWTAERFTDSEAIVFISAAGIAVRAIAPYIKDKFTDPAVLSADEKGLYVISLLSGHVGGANELTQRIASLISAAPVITTATDINEKFAVDTWAMNNRLFICDRTAAKEVSAALLDGNSIGFISDFPYKGDLPEGLTSDTDLSLGISISVDDTKKPYKNTLRLIPRIVTVGIGCRRGTQYGDIKAAVDNILTENKLSFNSIRALASIDVKADEQGLLEYAGLTGLPITFYSKAELTALKGDFTASSFVLETVGVDNVCERAAAMGGGKLIIKKTTVSSITVAAAADNLILRF